MEAHTFKSVAFGGFDKQDVIGYIEQTSREHQEAVDQLQKERDTLAAERSELQSRLAALEAQAQEQAARLAALQAEYEAASAQAAALSDAQAQAEALSRELAALRPDAESYRQFRDRIGDIECDARSRAAELEAATNAKLRQLAAEFREKYQDLTATFGITADYVTGELRKVEVNLTQLPRALDKIGVDLTALENTLQDKPAE